MYSMFSNPGIPGPRGITGSKGDRGYPGKLCVFVCACVDVCMWAYSC